MKIKISIILIIFLLLSVSITIPCIGSKSDCSIPSKNDEGWYFLPPYDNYAPSGLPDFDQKAQKDWKSMIFIWTLCAPTSLANIFWYFDSKNADPAGFPGDGNDTYPLVKDFQPPCDPIPGPSSDDHSFTNVNDDTTSLKKWTAQGELIEQIAWYVNHDFRRFPPLSFLTAGTRQYMMKWGVQQWIKDAGLNEKYEVEHYFKPDFNMISEELQNGSGIVLLLRFYNPLSKFFPIGNDYYLMPVFSAHYVSLSGIHPDGFIALSDPYKNVDNPDPTPFEHCDASVVSHDIYHISFDCPASVYGSWWLPNYWFKGGIASYALIISEV
jgi:hypothetical protein